MTTDFVLLLGIGFVAQLVDGTLGMAYGVLANTAILSMGIAPAQASALVHTAEIFQYQAFSRVTFLDLDPEEGLFGRGTWGWITGFVGTEEIDIDSALLDHDLALLPDPLASVLEGPDAAGIQFKGKAYTSYITSQCSTTFPSKTRKISTAITGFGPQPTYRP